MACTKIYRLAFEIYQNVPPEETVHAKAQRSAKPQRKPLENRLRLFFASLRTFAPLREMLIIVYSCPD